MLPGFREVLWLGATLWAMLEALVALSPLAHSISDFRSAPPAPGMGNPGIPRHTGAHCLTDENCEWAALT